ncbi:MAG: PAS domain S-box protein, partial [candidate division Zixibacteria bacterium]
MTYSLHSGARIAEEYTPWIDASSKIKLEATQAHLWFEEIISGDSTVQISSVWAHLDEATWFAKAMLDGGDNPDVAFVPLNDPGLQGDIEQVLDRLSILRQIARQRIDLKQTAGIGSEIDQRFDSIFNEFLRHADAVQHDLHRLLAADFRRFQIVQMILIALSVLLAIIVASLIHRFEKRKVFDLVRLEESEENYRNLIEGTDNLVTTVDDQGRFTFVNNAAHKFLGISPEECIGQLAFDFVHPDDREETKKAFEGWMRERPEVITFENRQQSKTGQVRDTIWTCDFVYNDDGSFDCINGIARDISDRKMAELALKNSEQQYEQLFNGMIDGFALHEIICDDSRKPVDYRFLAVNPSFEKLTGLKAAEVTGKRVREVIPELETSWIQKYGAVALTGEPISFEQFSVDLGRHFAVTAYRPAEGQFACNFVDITDRKNAEAALKESEEKYRDLVESSNDLIWKCDAQGRFTYLNPAWEGTHRYKVEEMLNRPFSEFQTQEVADRDLREFGKHLVGGSVTGYETTHVSKTGETIHLVFNAVPLFDSDGTIVGTQGTAYDITDRKRAEEALRRSEERFRALFDKAPVSYQSLDEDGNFLEVNDTWCQTLGYDRNEVIGRNFAEFIDPDRAEVFERCFPQFKGLGSIDDVEHMMIKKDGYRIVARFKGRIGHNEDGSFKQTHCTFVDVTERKQAEEDLKESEEKYRTQFESVLDAIIVAEADTGIIAACNPAAVRLFGRQKEELIGQHQRTLHPAQVIVGEFSDSFEKHRGTGQNQELNTKIITSGGVVKEVAINASTYRCRGKTYMQGVFRDITEAKRLQELESRAQRLETAGTIAGQVAHDFNNLLAPLMAYPDFIRDELPAGHSALPHLEDIENAAKKIADINQDLLTLGRRGHYNQEALNVNSILADCVKELGHLSESIECKVDLAEDVMNVSGGRAQIHRVFINLLINAVEASKEGDTVSIRTENYYVDDVTMAYGRIPRGEYVKITVSDTGCGMDEDTVQKIFDPFFTNKKSDKKRGSGLGLSVVDAVIKDHGGYMDLSTSKDNGTSFFIYLPTTREQIDNQTTEDLACDGETILIIDDDGLQRDVSTRLLRKLGYETSVVESGEKAIELLKTKPFDL